MIEYMFEKLLGNLSVSVIESDLPHGWWGSYDHATSTIRLHRALAPLQRRSTLTHELAHAALGHVGQSPRQERAAEELAATWLIRTQCVNPWRFRGGRTALHPENRPHSTVREIAQET